MKKLFHYMLPVGVLATIGAMPLAAQTDIVPVEEVKTYFTNVLEEAEADYTTSTPLTLEQLSEAETAVWNAWVEANKAFDEDGLIDLSLLKNKKRGSWTLPSDLEPNAVMNYYYGYKGERPEAGFPLFLYLHGSGTPDNEWSTGHNIAMENEDGATAYFIPRIPNTGDYYRWYQKSKQWAWKKLLRLAYVSGDINSNRVYFFGISEGGYGTQRLASYFADYLAGAGPMAGGEPLKNAPVENCRNIAFNFRTGADDDGFHRNTLTQYTKDAFEAMQEKYPDAFVHHIELIPGYGHHIDYYQTTPWLVQYERNPHPKHVIWENYDMDGVFRDGFYNLYIEEDPRGAFSYRVTYIMDIEDNNIVLKAQRTNYRTTETQDGIEMAFRRTYSNVNKGKIRVYLNDKLVDLSKPVRIVANDKLLFEGMVTPNVQDMVKSCATYFDPERVFSASVLIDLAADALAVEGVKLDEEAPTTYYDLSGRRVEQPTQGLFITNTGKKVKL